MPKKISPEVMRLRLRAVNYWFTHPEITDRQYVADLFGITKATFSQYVAEDPRYLSDQRSHGYISRQAKAKSDAKARAKLGIPEPEPGPELEPIPVEPEPELEPLDASDPILHPVSPRYREFENKLNIMMDKTKELDKGLIDKFNEQFVDMEKDYQKKLKLLEILNS